MGEWWEITDIPGPSFFVKSEYAVMKTPKYDVPTVLEQSTRTDLPLSSEAVIKQPSREHVSKGTYHVSFNRESLGYTLRIWSTFPQTDFLMCKKREG